MKTPMQELIEYIEEGLPYNKHTKEIRDKAKELLKKEKQTIIDTYKAGCVETGFLASDLANDYYNETFKND